MPNNRIRSLMAIFAFVLTAPLYTTAARADATRVARPPYDKGIAVGDDRCTRGSPVGDDALWQSLFEQWVDRVRPAICQEDAQALRESGKLTVYTRIQEEAGVGGVWATAYGWLDHTVEPRGWEPQQSYRITINYHVNSVWATPFELTNLAFGDTAQLQASFGVEDVATGRSFFSLPTTVDITQLSGPQSKTFLVTAGNIAPRFRVTSHLQSDLQMRDFSFRAQQHIIESRADIDITSIVLEPVYDGPYDGYSVTTKAPFVAVATSADGTCDLRIQEQTVQLLPSTICSETAQAHHDGNLDVHADVQAIGPYAGVAEATATVLGQVALPRPKPDHFYRISLKYDLKPSWLRTYNELDNQPVPTWFVSGQELASVILVIEPTPECKGGCSGGFWPPTASRWVSFHHANGLIPIGPEQNQTVTADFVVPEGMAVSGVAVRGSLVARGDLSAGIGVSPREAAAEAGVVIRSITVEVIPMALYRP